MFAQPSTETAPNILLVDDDAGLREQISGYLRQHGFVVHVAENAAGVAPALDAAPIRLIIMDIMMPGEDGLSACRRIAEQSGPPVIIMSAMGDETDRIVGLELGADDYLPKPCSPRELLARIRSVLRRGGAPSEPKRADFGFEFAGFRLDALRRQLVAPKGESILLTEGEFALLAVFLEHPGRILSRDELIELIKGAEADIFDRAIDVQISRLRRKLTSGDQREIIRTMRGRGYMFSAKVRRPG